MKMLSVSEDDPHASDLVTSVYNMLVAFCKAHTDNPDFDTDDLGCLAKICTELMSKAVERVKQEKSQPDKE